MGRVGAGGTAREAAAGSLLLLLLLLAQPPPAAARNSKESGEPAGLQRHPQRGPEAGGGADCDSRGAPVRSPDAALNRVLILGCAPCGASGPEKTPMPAFPFRARRVRSLGAYPTVSRVL